MKILFNDIIQYSNAHETLKSPMLTDYYNVASDILIILDRTRAINSIGIGNTNAAFFNITFDNGVVFNFNFTNSGLYPMSRPVTTSRIIINTNATYIGRIGAGIGIRIPTSIRKEPGFASTSVPRYTLSGQVIPGLGGYNYRTLSLDSRYKLNLESMKEIEEGYNFIGRGYPFFIDLSDESYKLTYDKLYATDKNQNKLSFESSVFKPLFSRRWDFEERF